MKAYTIQELISLNPANKRLELLPTRTVAKSVFGQDGPAMALLEGVCEYMVGKNSTTGAKSTFRLQWSEGDYNAIRAAYRVVKTAIKVAEGRLGDSLELAYSGGKFYLAEGGLNPAEAGKWVKVEAENV